MKANILFGVFLILSAIAVSAQNQFVPVFIQRAEIDGTDIFPFGFNQLNIERNEDFTLKLDLFAFRDVNNVEVKAEIDGYEYSDVKPISARYGPEDLTANVTYPVKLTLRLPDDVQLDDYKLRVTLSNRNDLSETVEFDLKIDTGRHAMKIVDVTLNPGSTVKAGQSLLSRVRLENKGQKTERDIKVTASIPALDLAASSFIEDIKSDKQEETEEMFLRLPRCATPGTYDVNVDVWFNKNHDKVSKSGKITVVENEACKEEPPVVIVQPVQNTTAPAAPPVQTSGLRTALEVVLLVLVALLVIVGLVIGFTRMREE